MPAHWRTSLLHDFAPDADIFYKRSMAQRPASLPALSRFATQYLELVELAVTGALNPISAGACRPDKPLHLPRNKVVGHNAGMCFPVNTVPLDKKARLVGRDWPSFGTTMVGHARLHNVRHMIEHALASNISGDFVELGVWRGGVAMYARAVLNVLLQSLDQNEGKRLVHLFDAFDTIKGYGPAEEYLAVAQTSVIDNMESFGLDKYVRFHPGLFNDSLRKFYYRNKQNGIRRQVAVLRIDGNFYESYMDALYYMWEFVPVGGFIIFDDLNFRSDLKRQGEGDPWADFKARHNLSERLIAIDWTSSFFRKRSNVSVNWNYFKEDREAGKAFVMKMRRKSVDQIMR